MRRQVKFSFISRVYLLISIYSFTAVYAFRFRSLALFPRQNGGVRQWCTGRKSGHGCRRGVGAPSLPPCTSVAAGAVRIGQIFISGETRVLKTYIILLIKLLIFPFSFSLVKVIRNVII